MRYRSRFLVITSSPFVSSLGVLALAGAVAASCASNEADEDTSSSGSGAAGPGGGSDGGSTSPGPSSGPGTGASGATGGSTGEGGGVAGQGGAGGATASSSSSTGGNAPCVDNDGDGWTQCDGDCCDAPGIECTEPAKVNPGAYEALGNLLDDDCDAATDDSTPLTCSVATLSPPTSAEDLTKAMDLCQFTTASPPLPQKKWGVISAELVLAAGGGSPDDIQRGVLANYGTAVTPQFGANMGALSSGTARDKGDSGWEDPQLPDTLINYSPGWNDGASGNPPADYLAAHGGDLPAAAGCPNGEGANDSANLKLSIRVPTNAQSFSYQFKFYTSEYPEWVCDEYNDFFLALLTSTASGIPADRNISFDANGNPVSVNNAFFQVCSPQGNNPCPDGVAELAGTGMATSAGKNGGGTSWLTTEAPITPGETIELRFIIWDTGDHWYDSLVLLDNFQWKLTPSAVGTHE
jgi:hypothetical protein